MLKMQLQEFLLLLHTLQHTADQAHANPINTSRDGEFCFANNLENLHQEFTQIHTFEFWGPIYIFNDTPTIDKLEQAQSFLFETKLVLKHESILLGGNSLSLSLLSKQRINWRTMEIKGII